MAGLRALHGSPRGVGPGAWRPGAEGGGRESWGERAGFVPPSLAGSQTGLANGKRSEDLTPAASTFRGIPTCQARSQLVGVWARPIRSLSGGPITVVVTKGQRQEAEGPAQVTRPARGTWTTRHRSLGGRSWASCWETMGSGGDRPHFGHRPIYRGSGTRPPIATQGGVGPGRPHLPRPQENQAIGASGEISRFSHVDAGFTFLRKHRGGETRCVCQLFLGQCDL